MSHLEPELLSAYLDDAVEADERATIEQHLPGCADCRRDLDALGFVRESARTLERPEIPALYRKQLWKEINRTRRAPATRWRALVAVAGTAAAIVAFAGLTTLGSSSGPNVLATDVAIDETAPVTDAELQALLTGSVAAYGMTREETADGIAPAEGAPNAQPMTSSAPPTATAPVSPGSDVDLQQDGSNHGAQIARCEEIVAPGGDGGAIAIQYLITRYEGSDVYVLLYDVPRDGPSHREVFVVTRSECRVLAHRSSV